MMMYLHCFTPLAATRGIAYAGMTLFSVRWKSFTSLNGLVSWTTRIGNKTLLLHAIRMQWYLCSPRKRDNVCIYIIYILIIYVYVNMYFSSEHKSYNACHCVMTVPQRWLLFHISDLMMIISVIPYLIPQALQSTYTKVNNDNIPAIT